MTENHTVIINRAGIPGLAVYLGVGFLCYAMFAGTGGTFHWDNAWLYAWLLLWPVMLFCTFAVWALLICIVAGLLFWAVVAIIHSSQFFAWRMRRVHDRVVKGSK